MDRMLTTANVANRFGVTRHTIYEWIDGSGVAKPIPAHRIGRRWMFERSEVDAWAGIETPSGAFTDEEVQEIYRDHVMSILRRQS